MARIVIALGGNALQKDGEASAEAQIRVAEQTARQLIALVRDGHEIVVVHGNGPQVGNIILREEAINTADMPTLPIDSCVAMSQGSIGYWLQLAIGNELRRAGVAKSVATVVTQSLVRADDEAFHRPSKPVGQFYETRAAAEQAAAGRQNFIVKEDAGRGWRRVVASPRPIDIIEKDFVASLVREGYIVVAAGGGGIPVVVEADGSLRGAEAVVDKDFAAEKLAEAINADILLILTAVDQVAINYNTPQEIPLGRLTIADTKNYIADGQFAAGSMLPKIEASLEFVKSGDGRRAIITTPTRAYDAIRGRAGTIITD
ncbi:carbamate kinase [Candidatus Saccharibacteria bacterium 32-49-12]|nr:MAG: carbamate kinase [Candidatus Saccharibacteria bacterium 32-49-12]